MYGCACKCVCIDQKFIFDRNRNKNKINRNWSKHTFWTVFFSFTWNATFFWAIVLLYGIQFTWLSFRFFFSFCIPFYSLNNLQLRNKRKTTEKFSIYLYSLTFNCWCCYCCCVYFVFSFSLWSSLFLSLTLCLFSFLFFFDSFLFKMFLSVKISTRRNEYVWTTTLLHHHLYRSDRTMAAQPIVYKLYTYRNRKAAALVSYSEYRRVSHNA